MPAGFVPVPRRLRATMQTRSAASCRTSQQTLRVHFTGKAALLPTCTRLCCVFTGNVNLIVS